MQYINQVMQTDKSQKCDMAVFLKLFIPLIVSVISILYLDVSSKIFNRKNM